MVDLDQTGVLDGGAARGFEVADACGGEEAAGEGQVIAYGSVAPCGSVVSLYKVRDSLAPGFQLLFRTVSSAYSIDYRNLKYSR